MVERVTLLTMQQTVILLIARPSLHIHVPMIARLTGRRSENYTRRMMERLVADRLLERAEEMVLTAGRSATSYRITDHGRARLAVTLEALADLGSVTALQRMLLPVRERTAMAPVLVRANYGNDTVVQTSTA